MRYVALALVVILAILTDAKDFPTVELKESKLQHFGVVLSTLLLLSIILERALDVILTALDGGAGDRTRAAVDEAREAVERLEQLDAPPANKLDKANQALAKAMDERNNQRKVTRERAIALGLLSGAAVSVVGFRALASLGVAPTATLSGEWFHGLDIFLTGAVLAGGSDGLHKLVEVYRHHMDKSSGNR